jgi:SPP1 family predicted phage head-tail adaptor
MPTGAGKLEFRIDLIKKLDGVTTDDGSSATAYQILATRWANSKPIGQRQGHQFLTTRNIEETNTHDFWIRHEDQFDNRGKVDHIRFKGRLYQIQNIVTERERDRFLKLESRILGDPSSDFNILPVAP